ncbi:peptidyl-prolyl cis-trans isomerase [Candidatus Omnitrophota bacterium]
MKRTLGICIFAVTLLVGLHAFTETEAVEDKIVAIVNDEVITQKYVDDFMYLMKTQMAAENPGMDIDVAFRDLKGQVITRLIEDRLIIQEAKRQEIAVDEVAAKRKLQEIRATFAAENEFNEYLLAQGLRIADLEQTIVEQLKMRTVVEREVKEKIFVHPKEVTEFYNANINQFDQPEGVNVDSIFIAKRDSDEETEKVVGLIAALLSEGKTFSEVVTEYSEADSLGVIRRGQLLKTIEDVVFSLEVGQVSEPVKTENGYFIFSLKEKIAAQVLELSEVQSRIYQLIFEQKFQEKFSEWINELKEKAYILIK